MSKHIYWRLSGFYFFYFASIGTLIPYLGLYLNSNGYSPNQIATIFAVIMGTKIIAPNIWGWIADHTGKRMRIIRFASLVSIICYAGIFYSLDYLWLVIVMFGFSFFWNANLPQFEAVTLSHLKSDTHRYSSIRLWGSLGFVLLVALLGAIFEQYDVNWFPYILLILLFGIWIFSWLTPESANSQTHIDFPQLSQALRNPVVIVFFIICFLLQASHGPYYAFYSLYLENNGYSRSIIGFLWAVGVIAEILVFLVMHLLLPKIGAAKLLIIALLLTTLRWWVIGHNVDSTLVLFLAQCLHAASFGVFHAVAIHQIHAYFPGRLQGRGQALYSSLSFGAGGAIGALYSGMTWEKYSAETTFNIAAVMGLIASILAIFLLLKEKPSGKQKQT